MPFISQIAKYKSLSIVGLDKNTGKTVCLNYVLRRLNEEGIHVGVTSIGVDGEQVDSVFATAKPEITLYQGSHFITSEKHYAVRQAESIIEDVSDRRTALGVLVTAKVLIPGKVLLSGASTTGLLKKQIHQLSSLGCSVSIVDGALSRLSLASPTITQAMILATGAAVSANIKQLIAKTKFQHNLISLTEVDTQLKTLLADIEGGMWGIDADNQPHDLGISSVFLLGNDVSALTQFGNRVFVSGAVTDRLLRLITPHHNPLTLVVRDFTKLFITPEVYADYCRHGHSIQVLQRSTLVAVTLNPTSPQGFKLDSDSTCAALSEALGIPVYDVMRIKHN
ncbi:MAG: hypothetical protein IJ761_05190 [Bacteroidales bacterium]|nr:hypothetical protein [Bacteroidales bacterium]